MRRSLIFACVALAGCSSALPVEAADAPEFVAKSEWVNGGPLEMAKLKGKVVVVHFWTHGCINCQHNYPHYLAWQKKYKDNSGLQIVGVHTPELDSEKTAEKVKKKTADAGFTFPVVVDDTSANWKAWGNRYWPAVYLVNKSGEVVAKWEGELGEKGYEAMTKKIEALLKESKFD